MEAQNQNGRQIIMPQMQAQQGYLIPVSPQPMAPVKQQLPALQTDVFITGGHIGPVVKAAAEMEKDFMQQAVEFARRDMEIQSTFTLEFIEE